jgi:hypothetical protein
MVPVIPRKSLTRIKSSLTSFLDPASTLTMAPKRKFDGDLEELPIEDLRTGLSSLISNYESTKSALL